MRHKYNNYNSNLHTIRDVAKRTKSFNTLRTLLIYWPSADYILVRIAEYEAKTKAQGLLVICMKTASALAETKRNTIGKDQGVVFCMAYLEGLLEGLKRELKSCDEEQLIEDFTAPFANWLLFEENHA